MLFSHPHDSISWHLSNRYPNVQKCNKTPLLHLGSEVTRAGGWGAEGVPVCYHIGDHKSYLPNQTKFNIKWELCQENRHKTGLRARYPLSHQHARKSRVCTTKDVSETPSLQQPATLQV